MLQQSADCVGGTRASSAACSRKLGWTRKDSGFNRCSTAETDGGVDDARIAVSSRREPSSTRNEPKKTTCPPRATANPTRVCLKPEALHESKEQFARRIRQAWIDREQSKSCINIYLARNVVEEPRPPAAELQAAAGAGQLQATRSAGGRAALEVQLLQSGVAAIEDSDDDDGEAVAVEPLSAAARRVRFYRAARRQRRDATPSADPRPAASCRAVSAPSAGVAGGARRLSLQEVPPQLHGSGRFPVRKLKSCRNRAFHKSIDADAGLHRGGRYGKPRNLQHGEVVTMMSLLSPVGSDTEENPARPADCDDASAKTVTFPQFNHNICYHQKSFDSAVQSIGKSRPLNNRVGKSLIKSRTLDISTSRDDEAEDAAVSVTKGPEEEEHCSSDNNAKERVEKTAEIAGQYDAVDGQPMLKSDKEKECWALFKKMTAKGVSVTFDTVLRGMLTPTEYRLRKNELLLFG